MFFMVFDVVRVGFEMCILMLFLMKVGVVGFGWVLSRLWVVIFVDLMLGWLKGLIWSRCLVIVVVYFYMMNWVLSVLLMRILFLCCLCRWNLFVLLMRCIIWRLVGIGLSLGEMGSRMIGRMLVLFLLVDFVMSCLI